MVTAGRLMRRAIASTPQHLVDGLEKALLYNFVDTRIVRQAHVVGPANYDERERVWRHAFEHFIGSPEAALRYFEFGVYRGDSIAWWAAKSRAEQSRFFGFDSFEGLPEAWSSRGLDKGHFDTDGRAPDPDDPRILFVKGWFSETLSPFFRDYQDRPGSKLVFHFDADLFSSTIQAGTAVLERFKGREMLWLFDEFLPDEVRAFRVLQELGRFDFLPVCCDSVPLRVALKIRS